MVVADEDLVDTAGGCHGQLIGQQFGLENESTGKATLSQLSSQPENPPVAVT